MRLQRMQSRNEELRVTRSSLVMGDAEDKQSSRSRASGSWAQAGGGDSVDKKTINKLGRKVGSINGSE